MPHPFFSLPRALKPAVFFEQLLPTWPLKLPRISLPVRVAYRLEGGGVWTVSLLNGKLQVQTGEVPPIHLQVTMTEAHFREALVGALHERHLEILDRLDLPQELPDLSQLKVDPARIEAALALGGSIAVVIRDREYADRYRYVFTLGHAPAAYTHATTTIELDADDLVTLGAAQTPPMKVLVSGKLRLAGDVGLPQRILSALMH